MFDYVAARGEKKGLGLEPLNAICAWVLEWVPEHSQNTVNYLFQ